MLTIFGLTPRRGNAPFTMILSASSRKVACDLSGIAKSSTLASSTIPHNACGVCGMTPPGAVKNANVPSCDDPGSRFAYPG